MLSGSRVSSEASFFVRCQFPHRVMMTCWQPVDSTKLQKSIQPQAKIVPEIDPNIEPKISCEEQEIIENIRKRSAETSKLMFPCGLDELFAKSAGFKKITKNVQIKDGNDTSTHKKIYL